jgi:hypothetical protein
MPKIAIYKFLTFFIFAFDAINEPPHLHIAKEKGNRQRSGFFTQSLPAFQRKVYHPKGVVEADINLVNFFGS